MKKDGKMSVALQGLCSKPLLFFFYQIRDKDSRVKQLRAVLQFQPHHLFLANGCMLERSASLFRWEGVNTFEIYLCTLN